MRYNPRSRRGVALFFILLVSANLGILLDIPIYRQVLGLVFLLLLPGLLILFLLKLNKLGLAEKIVLSIGLSTAFLIFFGLLINQSCLGFGYTAPLSAHCLILSLNLPLIALLVAAYIRNPEAFSSFPFHVEVNTKGKLGLLLPCFLPILSILGMRFLNTSGSNIVLLAFLCLIPVSIIVITLLKREMSTDTYPLVIVIVIFALLTMGWLRSEHILGHDVHHEYYIFYMTLSNQHFSALGFGNLDSCLSISLLPAIFQSILQIGGEGYLFKGVYVLTCTFTPLTVYIISKRYLGAFYAFLAAFFFTCQLAVLHAPGSPRTHLALFFFALCIMVLFNTKILEGERRALFLIFMAAIIVSHYSSTYVFFFPFLFTYLLALMFKKYIRQRRVSFISVGLFLAMIFTWYSEVMRTPFRAGVYFVTATVLSLQEIFPFDLASKGKQVGLALGAGQMNTLDHIYLVTTWLAYAFIAAGVIGMLIQRRRVLDVPQWGEAPPKFLKARLNMEYFLMALVCSGIAVSALILPHISRYGLTRSFPQLLVVLSPFFILGGMMLSKYLRLGAQWLILLLLIPYFMFVTGAGYEICGVHKGVLRSEVYSAVLSSEVPSASYELVYEQEVRSAQWLKEHYDGLSRVYAADGPGNRKLVSQGKFHRRLVGTSPFFDHKKVDGYIWLSYNNVANGKLTRRRVSYDMSDYSDILTGKNKVYTNGGSEVWR